MTRQHIPVPSTSRFSNRADNYALFRPGYPAALFTFIEHEFKLGSHTQIVDIGSGTGLFAEPLLERNYHVVCIEPNDDMRIAGERRLKKFPFFESIGSTAESTGLAAQSVNLVTIAQTFHWLDTVATKKECQRILAPGGQVVLAWNRQSDNNEFGKSYTSLRNRYRLQDTPAVAIDSTLIEQFYHPASVQHQVFPNHQLLDFEGLKGQLLSKSYIPLPGHDQYDDMISELIRLFVTHQQNGVVRIEYETMVYWGRLS